MVVSSSFLLLLTGMKPVPTLGARYRGGVRGFSINDEESVKSVHKAPCKKINSDVTIP